MAPRELVLGVDAGGTATRVLLTTLDGDVVASGGAGGGNPVSSGVDVALGELALALKEALSTVDPARVGHAVLGMAGDRLAGRDALDRVWRSVGLTCDYEIVGDAVVAFSGATPERRGSVLVAGTGAVAVRVEDGRVTDFAGGLGWLLGDEGAGFWFGRAAVRTAIAAAQGRADAPELARLVVTRLLGESSESGGELANRLILAVCERPPLALAGLAPLVFVAAELGEPAAHAILDEAAVSLDALLTAVQDRTPDAPVVFAGSCLTNELLRDRVTALLRIRSEAPVLAAAHGVTGAAWLAAAGILGRDAPELTPLHARLLAGFSRG